MDIRSLISKMDAIEQGLNEAFNIKAVQQQVGSITDAGQRHAQLATMAQQNGVPGLYDPVEGDFVSADGSVSRTASHEVDNLLASKGLMPQNAQTSTFLGKMFGTSGDAYDKGLQGQSSKVVADQTSAEFKQKKFAELQDLMKQLSALKKVDATPAATQTATPATTQAAPAGPTGQAATPSQSVTQNSNGTFTLTKKDGTKFNISADGKVVKEMKDTSLSSSLIESFGYTTEDATDTTLAATQAGGIVGQHGLAKAGLTGAAKVAGKFVPVAGTLLSAKDAYERWTRGDRTGAVISALAGAGWLIPGPAGWVLGGSLDAANLGRDLAGNKSAAPAQAATPAAQGAKSDPKIVALQKYLKSQGADLGTFGPNKDGIDGVMGSKTRTAMDKANLAESQKMAIWRILTDSYEYEQLDEGKLDFLKDLFTLGKAGSKEAIEIAKDMPIGSVVKDAQGANWKWMGGRWEKEVTPGAGNFNMNAGVATPGKGKTNAVAQELEAAYRAEAEAAKKTPGGINAWIKANPKKAMAIGLGVVGAAGVGGYVAGGPADDTTANTGGGGTGGSSTTNQAATPEQVCSPEQIALIGKVKGVMGELADIANNDPALAQVMQTYQTQIDAMNCGGGQGATPSGRTPLEDYAAQMNAK